MGLTFLPGTLNSISANFINPYTGELLSVNGDYYINDTPVTGTASPNDILITTVENQFFRIEDDLGNLLISGFETILMADGDDILHLASTTHVMGDVTLEMGGGNDIVWANAGNDIIRGDTGNDILHGGPGNDTLEGGNDDDILTGASGNDTIDGGTGIDTAIYFGAFTNYTLTVNADSITVQDNVGNDGTDTVLDNVEKLQFADGVYENGVFTPNSQTFIATAPAEAFVGGTGIDTVDFSNSTSRVKLHLYKGTGSQGYAAGDTFVSIENIIGSDSGVGDVIFGDMHVNEIYGLAGSDLLEGEGGADKIDGGDGGDFSTYKRSDAAVDIDLNRVTQIGGHAQGDELISIENIIGSNHNDVIVGDAGGNKLYGGKGDDDLSGGAGNDKLYGHYGDDTFRYTSGRDYMNEFGSGADQLIFDAVWNPMDVIVSGNQITFAGNTVDRISFNNINLIESFVFDGYAAMDLATLQSYASPVTVTGTTSNDTLIATVLAETFEGQNGNDTVSYINATSRVKLDMATGGTESDAAGDSYISIENIIGSAAAIGDVIFGDAGNNQIWGMAGNDLLEGGAGADIIDGGSSNDFAKYTRSSAGVDVDLTRASQFFGDAQGDVLINIEHLMGSDFADTLAGNAGRNNLYGGDGNDTLNARDGNDNLFGENGADTLIGGNGNDKLNGGNGNDALFGGNDDDILSGGAGNDTHYGQAGADTFLFEGLSTFGSNDTITDFSLAENDKIDVADLLVNYDPLTDAITDFIEITDDGTDSFLSIDATGTGSSFVQIAELSNVTGLTDEEALETAGTLITI